MFFCFFQGTRSTSLLSLGYESHGRAASLGSGELRRRGSLVRRFRRKPRGEPLFLGGQWEGFLFLQGIFSFGRESQTEPLRIPMRVSFCRDLVPLFVVWLLQGRQEERHLFVESNLKTYRFLYSRWMVIVINLLGILDNQCESSCEKSHENKEF